MDCPHRIPYSGTLVPHHKAHRNHHNRSSLGTTEKTEKEETGPDHSLDTANIVAQTAMTCTEATHDDNNGTGTAAIEAAQDDPIQHTKDTAAGSTMTYHTGHTANPPCTAAH